MTKENRRKQRRRALLQSLPGDETSEQLKARLKAFVQATRGRSTSAVGVPFPEDVSVLAGPLRKRLPAQLEKDQAKLAEESGNTDPLSGNDSEP